MDSRPDINTVHQAICTLYGQDAQASGKASVWLGEFQKSLFAWEISDKLLLERRDEVSCYFAAQTMRTKIQYSFHELPSETYQSLRDSIMLHLGTCLNLPTSQCKSVVITQLCLALVDLYLQVPSWKGYVAEIINKFSSGAETSLLLLNILKVFPEENESQHLRLGANRRQEIWVELSQQTNTVLEFLSKICQTHSNDEETLQKSFGCLSSWLINPEVPTDALAQSPLLQSILELFKNPVAPSSLHEAGTDCIVAALFKAEDSKKHGALAHSLHNGVRALVEPFHLCVAQEDGDKLQNYARLFTELAESTVQHLLDTPGQGLGDFITLDLLLVTIGYHDYSLAEMTFNVWYRLSEMLYQTDSDPLTEMFRPYATRFILALYRHCRFDSDFDGTPDDNEEFRDFRDRAREAARDVVFISGAEPTLKHLFEILKTQGPQSSWDETESALYIMASISKNILPNEDEVVPHVVDAVLQLPPSTHLCLRFTAIRLLGQINEWINNNPQYCEGVLKWLLDSLCVPKLSGVTAESLEFICIQCRHQIAKYFDLVLKAALMLDSASPNADENAVVGVHRACAVVLCHLPSNIIGENLQQMCQSQAQRLNQHFESVEPYDRLTGDISGKTWVQIWLQTAARSIKSLWKYYTGQVDLLNDENLLTAQPTANNENDPSKASRDPAIPLDRLAAIFRNLNPNVVDNGTEKPWLPVIRELWPLLLETCRKFETNQRITEHCCRTIRFAIRSLGVQSFPFIEPLVKQMVEIYQRYPHSCLLYLGSILVDEYGGNADLVPGLIYMLEAFSVPTFTLLEPQNGLLNHPDTVDDLFRLTLRFVQKAPLPFFLCNKCESLYNCCLVSIFLDHPEANKSVTKFFTETVEFLLYARKNNMQEKPGVRAAEKLVSDFGETLVNNAILASLFHLSRRFVRDMADILFCFSKLSQERLSEWLKESLKNIPQRGGLSATPQQLEAFHNEVLGARDLRGVSDALRELIRLYR